MSAPIPLCVDLDGTLLLTDTLSESLLILLKSNPLSLFQLPLWLLRGRAHLKQEVAGRARPDPTALPVNTEVLEYLRQQHQSGRKLLLVSGTDTRIAQSVADQFDLFDEVCASDGKANLSGHGKARILVERFGKGGFDYAGNARVDLVVWAEARQAIVVSHRQQLARKAAALCEVEKVFHPPAVGLQVWLEALRVRQWAKNLLIFLPLLVAYQWHHSAKPWAVLLASFAFCIGTSSVCLYHDLFHLEADRHHATKRQRPLASGRLPVLWGIAAAPVLLVTSILIALSLPWRAASP